ncbi:T9SS type A sorting domain-containing protein [Pedobacter fastidiosus]|uniref:T9SS type A sorting domain-containing protein n=1 Tax=Pedobacter fastidiosus TaxID=2765361 RepID=A0ABR7KT76_9SPHI|nr:T9SS type A sorting domain-containing protein [Pedobacter fastidiosus]MBC6111314.1 T9SS type A sorting domain-containing protein [Pedobacter fastidiosus]
MRKIYIVLLLMFGCFTAFSQDYKASIKLDVRPSGGNYGDGCDNKIEIYIKFTDGSEEAIIPYIDLNDIPEGPYTHYEASIVFPANKIPYALRTRTSRQWRRLVGGCGGNGSHQNADRIFGIGYCHNYFDEEATPGDDNFAVWWTTRITLDVNPVVDIISPANGAIFPNDDKITLNATSGFQSFVYNWQYRVGISGSWEDMPTALNTSGKETIELSGKDLLGANFDTLYGNSNVFFRIKYCNNLYTPILTVTPRLSSPHITSVTQIPNVCFGESNGSLKIQFDRALVTGETLNVLLEDTLNHINYLGRYNLTELETGNTVTWPDSLAPGQFKISVIGKFPNSSIATYTEASSHTGRTGFTGPTAVGFNISKRDVYCNSGKDGTITINASGGNGGYKVLYKKAQDATYAETAFSAAVQHIITALDTGTYKIRVIDQRGCFTKDESGNEVILSTTIVQPVEALHIDYKQITNPTAFGFTNGSIQAIIVGGTSSAGNYNIEWTDINGNNLTTFTNTNNPFKTTLNNVGNGRYILKITDANYALAQAANASSCIVIDTFTVKQPEPLKVVVEQFKYISCKGDADGQLYAKASGGIEISGSKYIYDWSKEINNVWTAINQPDSIITGLSIGNYKVKITDANGITKESVAFMLSEPVPLAISLSATPVNCDGNSNGTAKAIVTGGTLPYHIEWSNGDTTTTISQLTQGKYIAFVKDSHGCEIQSQIEVSAPNPMVLASETIKQPTCYGSCDASINYNINGGTKPYQFHWSNGATTQNINNICAGTYTLQISDAQGCTKSVIYNIVNPEAIKVDAGPDVTLCVDQTHTVDAAIGDANATYKWTSTNGFMGNTAKITLANAGTYWIEATSSKGCIGRDTLEIKKSTAVIASEFVVSTQAFKGENVKLINITNPAPQTAEWIVPNTVAVISKTSDELVLRFAETGIYTVSLKATVGECTKIFTKQISVIESTSFNDPGTVKDPFIKSFSIAPNPNNGNFYAKIELQDISKIKLRLLNTITGQVIDTREENGSSSYNLPYHLTLSTGVYVMVLETSKENMVYKVLIQ